MIGYVFYPDGGCRGQHEYGGAGIHGYRWNLKLPAKGIGHTTHSATFRGYEPKAETSDFANKEVRAEVAALGRESLLQWLTQETNGLCNFFHRVPVEQYYDCFVPLEYGGTNNTAELNAAIHCLERIVAEPDFERSVIVVLRQDSRYVVDGYSRYLPNWLASDFTRKDGTLVSNKELWLRLHEIVMAITERNISVQFEWVEGHGNCPGNNSADELATAGVFTSKNPNVVAELDTSFRISKATDYWASSTEERHPMLCLRYGYLSVDTTNRKQREYYLSTQGKVADITGKRTSNDGFSVVRCNPQGKIEEIISKQVSIPREIDYKFQINIDNVYGANSRYLDLYGTDFLHRALDHKRHLQTYGQVLLTTELHPPYLVDRVFDNMDILADFLDTYKKTDEPTLMTTEITSDFFNYTEVPVKVKKGEETKTKTVCTLKPEIIIGYFKHVTQARWKETNGEVRECELILRMGVDLPDRNALRRIESLDPKVYLLTNTLGPGSFMHAVIIEAGEDVGIWSGVNSSIRIIIGEGAEKKSA